jgi:hypothetical protein
MIHTFGESWVGKVFHLRLGAGHMLVDLDVKRKVGPGKGG